MKILILAGGLGTRLSEETGLRPKPMVEIGDKPILWHIYENFIAIMASMTLSFSQDIKAISLKSIYSTTTLDIATLPSI